MSSLSEQSLQLRLDRRSGTLSEVDRAHFEKQQVECIQKAIKNEECPAKEKHVRRCIIGTWQERGNSFFWSVLGRQPLPSQVFMCWKSLTVMHRVFREGHPNVLRDSYVYRKTLRDLFSVYRFQAGTYGTLVCQYLKILQSKLELHKKYPGIIGSLSFSEENPIKIPDKDINDVFTFAVESFDYQDSLLALEEAVFKTLDKGRNNSQILASQCRIAALIPLLKECSGMYDVLVFVMVKLHKNLPPDTLDGHRQRFYEQHKKLKMFCMEASNLQYVTNLTPIPDIPDQPPDFLIHRYEPKQERPRDEPKPVQITPKIDERDVLIEQLMREIDELRMQLDETKRKAQDMENNLRMQIVRLQQELKSLQTVAKQACDENVFLKKQMEEQVKDDTDAQEKAKSADEKFNKLKAVYAKLRQDHILLLKKQSEVKQKEENSDKLAEETQEQLRRLQNAADEKTRELHMAKANMDELEKVNQALKIEFDQSDQSNKDRIASLSKEIAQLTKALHDTEIKAKIAANELEATRNLSEGQLKALQEQLQHLSTGKITEETARKSAEDAISKLKEGNAMAEARLSAELAEARAALVAEEKSRRAAEEANLKLSEQLKSECARLLSDIARLSKDREIELDSKMRTQAELEKLQQHSSGEISTLSSELLGLRREREMLLHDKEQLVRDLQSRQAQLDRETAELRARLGQSQSEFVEQSASRKLAEEQLRKATHEFESKLALMTSSLSEAQSSKTREESAKKQAEELAVKARLDYEAQLVVSKKQKEEEDLRAKYELLASAARNCEEIIEQTLALFNDSKHESGTTCTAEYLKSTLGSLCERVDGVSRLFSAFHSTHDGILPLVGQLSATTHMISDALIHGKATSHMGSVDESKNLVHHCRRVGDSTLKYLSGFKSRNTDPALVQQDDGKLKLAISELMKLAEELIPKQADSVEGVDNIVGEEMQATEKLVNDAAARIEEMLNKSRKHHSGVQLEVNERILDSCTGLMKAIRELILKSKDLQDEIVAEGRGSASARDFYKRHHKWTEGLLSAAKSVGMGATLLVNAADKVVERKGKFEELIVVSHEISASTAQLVAASRVKASKNSQKLPPLMAASKGVGNATAEVVAAVRTGAEMTDIAATVPDYSKLTLTQAKRFEMDAQVKILELEDNLSKERSRLGQLRKAHYQLAVELYGEEQVNMPELNASQPSRFQR